MKAFAITDIGRVRSTNQDYVFCCEEAVGSLGNLFGVADGMGGHKAGDFASKYCVEKMLEYAQQNGEGTPADILQEAITYANKEVYEASKHHKELEGTGTTLVAGTIQGDSMVVANIGDSRCYLIHDSSTHVKEGDFFIEQITEDHSLVEMMIQNGEISREEAKTHPNKNVITRAVGATGNVQADFFQVKLVPGDLVLFCTDGLTNMVEDAEILSILHENGSVLSIAAGELIKKANEAGGKDNIGIVIVQPF